MMIADGYRDEHLAVDQQNGSVSLDARPMRLTRKERDLLAFLAENEGEIVPREVLLERVWGYSPEIRTRTLDVHIRRLRQKLGQYGELYIETIFGIGYRFQRYHVPRVFPPYMRTLAATA